MEEIRKLTAIGLMSGASGKGVDAALVETDGFDIFENKVSLTNHYDDVLRQALCSVMSGKDSNDEEKIRKVELLLTLFHGDTVRLLLEKAGRSVEDIDVIGFHGHTVLHNAALHVTRQLGNAELLANELKINVVSRFRNVDIKAGGQGAPLEPAFLLAALRDEKKPLGVINIGGIMSVTLIGENGEMQAFHAGTGNVLVDKFMNQKYGLEMDFEGLEAARGKPDEKVIEKLLRDDFFTKTPPKSLDAGYFDYALDDVKGLALQDAVATLTAFSAYSLAQSVNDFAFTKPQKWIVCGGGANNPTLCRYIRESLGSELINSKEVGINPDTMEAQSFAFLAVRSVFGLPLTFPQTTGVAEDLSGGKLFVFENKGINNGR